MLVCITEEAVKVAMNTWIAVSLTEPGWLCEVSSNQSQALRPMACASALDFLFSMCTCHAHEDVIFLSSHNQCTKGILHTPHLVGIPLNMESSLMCAICVLPRKFSCIVWTCIVRMQVRQVYAHRAISVSNCNLMRVTSANCYLSDFCRSLARTCRSDE